MRNVLQRVVFVGGDPRMPSVRIRCVDVARRLGCDHAVGIARAEDVPDGKDLFVLVNNRAVDRRALRRRGTVVWDVHNHMPPAFDVDHYLVSTDAARDAVRRRWLSRVRSAPVHVIPHHHSNFENDPNPVRGPKTVLWMGTRKWYPSLDGVEHEFVETTGLTLAEIHHHYRRADILVHHRNAGPARYVEHVRLNPGAKLINAIGYGLPSISPVEPAFEEIGVQCTILATSGEVGRWVRELKRSTTLYDEIRGRCIARAPAYSLDRVAAQYADLLESIAN